MAIADDEMAAPHPHTHFSPAAKYKIHDAVSKEMRSSYFTTDVTRATLKLKEGESTVLSKDLRERANLGCW
jgi:hypothetical protein